MSGRKAPRCRSCKHPMKGHNKLGLCLSASPEVMEGDGEEHSSRTSAHSYMSPPPTPPPSSFPPNCSGAAAESSEIENSNAPIPFVRANRLHRTYTPTIMSEASFVIPATGYFHRRNPNYVHEPPDIDLPESSGSQTPTVIIGSDGESVALSDRSRSSTPPATPRASRYNQLDPVSQPLYVIRGTNAHRMETAPRRSYSVFDGGVSFLGNLKWKRALPLPTPQSTWVLAAPKLDAIRFVDPSKQGVTISNSIPLLIFIFVVCIAGTIMGTYITKYL